MTSPTSKAITRRLLLSRFLTRAGDQAWDFAVPLTLVKLFPETLQIAAVYYLCIRAGQVLLAPRIGRLIDRWQRVTVVSCGIGLQTVGMLLALAIIFTMVQLDVSGAIGDTRFLLLFGLLAAFGLASSLGALIMEIAVANDIVPAVIKTSELATVNSRLKQIDLATEVGSPIVAGILLSMAWPAVPLAGFALVAAWNVLSFLPEYLLVRSVLTSVPALLAKPVGAEKDIGASLLKRLSAGWRHFFAQPIMPAMVAYSFLWLSVLSPHGVLLTAFLKGGWHVSEVAIGVFRGAGAVFGLGATYLYPILTRRMGMLRASRTFITFQAACLIAALFFFHSGATAAFLAAVLLSRVGLYGFDLGETQLRQTAIPETLRGEVNAFAAALTSVATLGLYGAGAIFTSAEDFYILVYSSVGFVCLGAVIFSVWSWNSESGRPQRSPLDAS